MGTRGKGYGSGFSEIWLREMGLSQPRKFAHQIAGSEVLVMRTDLYGKLNGHGGCVNTVQFSPTGDLLLSGSDDRQVILWDWAAKTKKFTYPSGHEDNVFQARIMPFTDDRTIVTSAADGQIRLGQITEKGQVNTKKLAKHLGRVHKLAIEPGSPHIFYSCGEDGVVQHFDLRSHSATKLFSSSPFTENKSPRSSIRLNAITINPRNPNYFAVGGSDEYARVYDIRIYQLDSSSNSDRPVDTFSPHHLIGSNNVHITGLAYSNNGELLVSYNDELVYLFQKDMGIGPTPNPRFVSQDKLQKLEKPQVYEGHRNSHTVKGVSFFGPSDEYVLSGSDCGHIFMWEKKGGKLLRLMNGDKHIVNCIESHPYVPVLATSGIEKDVKLWAPIAKNPIPLPDNLEEIMDANKQGREERCRITLTPDVIMHVLRLQRRQNVAHTESRYPREDYESDDDDQGEAYFLRLADDASSDEGSNSRECNIS